MQLVRGALGLALAAAVTGAAASNADTEIVAVGGMLAPIALEDQHGQLGGVDASTRAVLLTRDMDAGSFVREALAMEGAAKLERAGAVYVADVHRMPAPIRRLISLPRMRERPYRVLLDTDGGPTAALPFEDGKVTWLLLSGLRVVEVRFLASSEDVGAALAGAVPAGE
jgi:hypothetical protein